MMKKRGGARREDVETNNFAACPGLTKKAGKTSNGLVIMSKCISRNALFIALFSPCLGWIGCGNQPDNQQQSSPERLEEVAQEADSAVRRMELEEEAAQDEARDDTAIDGGGSMSMEVLDSSQGAPGGGATRMEGRELPADSLK